MAPPGEVAVREESEIISGLAGRRPPRTRRHDEESGEARAERHPSARPRRRGRREQPGAQGADDEATRVRRVVEMDLETDRRPDADLERDRAYAAVAPELFPAREAATANRERRPEHAEERPGGARGDVPAEQAATDDARASAARAAQQVDREKTPLADRALERGGPADRHVAVHQDVNEPDMEEHARRDAPVLPCPDVKRLRGTEAEQRCLVGRAARVLRQAVDGEIDREEADRHGCSARALEEAGLGHRPPDCSNAEGEQGSDHAQGRRRTRYALGVARAIELKRSVRTLSTGRSDPSMIMGE